MSSIEKALITETLDLKNLDDKLFLIGMDGHSLILEKLEITFRSKHEVMKYLKAEQPKLPLIWIFVKKVCLGFPVYISLYT